MHAQHSTLRRCHGRARTRRRPRRRLRAQDHRKGGRGGKPRPGQVARPEYALRLADDTVIEEDAERSITVGNEGDGLDLGVAEMRVGERSRLEVRFDRGFGEAGLGRRRVPPRATLFYDVELIAVADDVSSSNNDPLALPASDGAQSVTVGGEAVAMEELGPIVINTDGTTARITNWPEMTPAEQEKTRRVIAPTRSASRSSRLRRAGGLRGIWMSSACGGLGPGAFFDSRAAGPRLKTD